MSNIETLRNAVRSVPDFPKPGVLFRDLTPILQDPELLELCTEEHCLKVSHMRGTVDIVVGMESRGFWFGPSVARYLGAGFVPARKPGKLPAEVVEASYGLEYGTDRIQLHRDAIQTNQVVLIVDDLLATGGTALAVAKLVREVGGDLNGFLFAIELDGLGGRGALQGLSGPRLPIESILKF